MSSFKRIASSMDIPETASRRYKTLEAYERLLSGTFYDHLQFDWTDERRGSKIVKIFERKPSTVYNLAELIANDTTSLMWTEEHSPYAACWNGQGDTNPYQETEDWIEALREEYLLDAVMMEASYLGSVGSVAIVVRQLAEEGKVFLEVVRGKQVIPIYGVENPNVLKELRRLYPIRGVELVNAGYPAKKDKKPDTPGIDPDEMYWMRIDLDAKEEIWYNPIKDTDYDKMVNGAEDAPAWRRDDERSWSHDFDCCPAVFMRNTIHSKNGIDGEATYGKVVDLIVEMDYLISQIGRGFRANLDPVLKLKRGEMGNISPIAMTSMADLNATGGEVSDVGTLSAYGPGGGTRNPTVDISDRNVLPLDGKDSDAEFMEIQAEGFRAGQDWHKWLRELAIEIVGGMKSDQEHSGGTQSGRALEILHKKLIWLIERLRVCYGARGFVPLLRILLGGVQKGIVTLENPPSGTVNVKAPIRLEWPKWNMPDGAELLDIVSAFELAAGGSQNQPIPLMSHEIAARFIAMYAGESDPKRAVGKWQKELPQIMKSLKDTTEAVTPEKPEPAPGSGPTK